MLDHHCIRCQSMSLLFLLQDLFSAQFQYLMPLNLSWTLENNSSDLFLVLSLFRLLFLLRKVRSFDYLMLISVFCPNLESNSVAHH